MDVDEVGEVSKGCRLRCTELPKDLLTRSGARRHFEQFGRIVRLILKPRSRSCIIEYDTIENAQMALLNAGEYMEQPFSINWYEKSPKIKRTKKDLDPDWVPDSEVEAELAAMAAVGNREGYKKKYNLRPEGMVVDAFPEAKAAVKRIRSKKKLEGAERKSKIKPRPPPRAWTSDQLELIKTLKQPAFTAEEKFKVLEARDKLIRLRTKQDIDISKATHMIGTCPDMCPEKERLMREIQHQVALYEQDSSGRGMNPMLAVKQYSRSSADQEVPLLHELRPVAVLQLTMEYLMYCIMNLCDSPDVNLAEWYHFLWDRTRSIRKDITQQELCCQGSVALLEQCARFHIHCSARLVAEDLSVFDQKINTENLTKCLQTLKYMYHDLSLKGESCPKEAEFRAYIILLNLNDGNFMWEVQQLKQQIQKSPEIKFALEVYSAIDKNNFVKFFKLLRSTNYLNACILLRYFVQVRTKALSAILKCYSPRSPYTQFALVELEHLLAFEDIDSVRDFIISYGLYFNSESTHVILDRKSFQLPESPYILDRAIQVVESKRSSSVGEVVYGGPLPLPKFENYKPQHSFDQTGHFIMTEAMKEVLQDSPVINEDQVDSTGTEGGLQKREQSPKLKVFTSKLPHVEEEVNVFRLKPPLVEEKPTTFASKPLFPSTVEEGNKFKVSNPSAPFWSLGETPSVPSPSIFDLQNSKTATNKSIFGAPLSISEAPPAAFVAPQTPNPMGTSIFRQHHVLNDAPKIGASVFGLKEVETGESYQDFGLPPPASQQNWFVETPAPKPTLPPVMATPSFVVPVSRSPIKSLQPDEEKQLELKQLEELEKQKRKLKEKQEQLKREMEAAKRRAEEKRRKEAEQERLKMERQQKLDEQRRIALQVEKERKQAQEIQESVTKLMQDLLTKVEANHKRERLKEIRLNVRKHKASLFFKKWLQKVAIKKRKREAMDQNPIWLPSRNLKEEAKELLTNMQSLNLENFQRYKSGKPMEIQLPHENPLPTLNIPQFYTILLTSHSKICARLPQEVFWKVTVSLPDFQEMRHGLNYVEDVLTDFFGWQDRYGTTSLVGQYVAENRFGYCLEKKQGVLPTEGNSNGFIFIAHESCKSLNKRVTAALKHCPRSVRVPVFLTFLTNDLIQSLDEDLEETLETNENVSKYDITTCKFTMVEITKAIERGLVFLGESVEKPPPLELDTLQNLLYLHVATEPWERIQTYAAWNSKYESCLKSPNLVINLYNEAVERLKEIVLDKASLGYQNFPDEFDKFLATNEVPEVLPTDYRYFPAFWKLESYRNALTFILNSLRLPVYKATWPPANETQLEQDILTYCSQIFENPQAVFYKKMAILLQDIQPAENFERISEVLWPKVIKVMAIEKLCQTDFSLKHTQFHTKSVFDQFFAVYNVKTLNAHSNDEWFYLKNPMVEMEIKQNVRSKKFKNKSQSDLVLATSPILTEFELDELEKSVRQETTLNLSQNKSDLEEIELLMADLEESMEIHKRICKDFQKNVRKILDTK